MASVQRCLRATLIAAAFFGFAVPPLEHPAAAQQNGANADRDDRGGRNGRRGGGPRGDRNGGPGGNRGDDNNRPAEPRPSTSASAPTANSFGTVSDAERIRESATETIKSNDKDGNGILEGEELSKLGMSRDADLDGDGKITHNELFESRMLKAKAASTSNAASTVKPAAPAQAAKEPVSTEPAERVIVNKARKSYRFKTTKERLSTWRHASKDANGDGQVSMSEYSRSWTERTANEFKRLDKDNDGMITVEEAK